jgi:membrane protease subunit (stomatin/prohibitin family)
VARTAVVAGTATAVSGRVRGRQEDKRMDEQQQAYDEQLAAQQAANEQAMDQQAPAPAPAEDDLVTQIERLGKLKDQGLLTEDEFAAQKAKLLA